MFGEQSQGFAPYVLPWSPVGSHITLIRLPYAQRSIKVSGAHLVGTPEGVTHGLFDLVVKLLQNFVIADTVGCIGGFYPDGFYPDRA